MNKYVFLLLLGLGISTAYSAESTKTVFNPFTGKLDYITSVNGTNFASGSGVTVSCSAGVCTFSSAGGAGVTVYPATATASFPFGFSASTAAFTGPGDGGISFTIGSSTYGVIAATTPIAPGHLFCGSSTNYTAIDCGLPGTGTPGGSAFQVQYSSASGTAFAGSPNMTNNGSTITLSGIYQITETNVSTKSATGVYFDYTGSSQTVDRLNFSGPKPSVNVTGGATPTLDTGSTDMVGRFTWSNQSTAGTVTFSKAWLSAPYCVAVSTFAGLGTSATDVLSSTFTFSGLVGSTVTYHCTGGSGR